jgi:Cu2+-exporting ATPase
MLSSAGALARNGVLARRLQALETIATVDTIIFDKTGTLTKDRIKIAKIDTTANISQQQALQLAASIAQYSLHPVSQALVAAWDKQEYGNVSDVREISGYGLTANSELGAIKLGSAQHCGITAQQTEAMQLHMANERGWLATFTLEEEIRTEAKSTIKTLLSHGFKVAMLSGDRASSAQAVANQLGINDVLADCTPQQKLAYMQKLQAEGQKIVMVGDGLNDGPVLAGAHVSVAMGQAVPLAQAQSDFVVQSGQLNMLLLLIVQARRTMQIVKQNLIWAAVYNAVCIPLAVLGYLPAWLAGLGMASSSLFVVLNALRLSRITPSQQELI